MDAAQEPSEVLVEREVFERRVGLGGGRHIDHGQHDAGRELDHEAEQGRAAEDIKPTARALRDMVPGGGLIQLGEMQAVVHPQEDPPRRIGEILQVHAVWFERFGITPPMIKSSPFSTFTS